MASAFTHAIAGLAIGTAFRRPEQSARFWTLGVVGAVIPDLDGIGFWLGVPYDSVFGHRGFTHSLVFAALFASLCLFAFNPRYFFPWRPILVSPMSVRRFFTARGLAVLASEVVWVWVPAALFAVAMMFLRRNPPREPR